MASPVFKAMLSPRFQEGTQLKKTGWIELNLPDDSATGMTTICRIAHLQNRFVPNSILIPELLDISRVCDKYDFREMLSTHANIWITASLEGIAMNKEIIGDSERLLMAAYKLGNAATFAKVGQEIVSKGVGAVGGTKSTSWAAEIGHDLDEVFDALTAERRRVQDYLNEEIAELIDVEVDRRQDERDHGIVYLASCTFAEKLLYFVMESLRSKTLWPPQKLLSQSLESTLSGLQDDCWTKLPLDRIGLFTCDAIHCVGGGLEFSEDGLDHIARRLKEARAKSQKMIRPLCYECVRHGKILEEGCEHRRPQEAPRKM